MIFLVKILSGIIFILLGLVFFYKSIETFRREGKSTGFIEIIGGIVFIAIGILIFVGYIS